MTYEYDDWGNLTEKNVYAYTTAENPGTPTDTKTYDYDNTDWGDQLTGYNGQTITYDPMGNPTMYRGKTLTWRGKQLTGIADGTDTIAYSYDENGLRLQKTVNNVVTDYYYNGSVLIGMQQGTNALRFSYDAAGAVAAVDFNGTYYYYVRNGQGDIVKLIDGSRNTVVEYAYDSWGKLLSCTGTLATSLGTLNPFRYRGYVYDEETQWYYLKSRYYDPETCRFISADVLLSTGQGVLGHNCYAYCLDNPVNLQDTLGSRADLTVNMTGGGGSSETYSYGALTLTITSSTIIISANMYFTGDLTVDTSELISGIKEYWDGKYDIDGKTYSLSVKINVVDKKCQNCIIVNKYDAGGTSYTESLHNWSSTKSRKVVIYTKWDDDDETSKDYAWTAAHEFGHCLGVYDYYKLSKAEMKAYPGRSNYVSIFNKRGTYAQIADVKKVLVAFRTNTTQGW